MNAVERKPVETRVLNPNASETSYKPEQRKKDNFFVFIFFRGDFGRGDFVGGFCRGDFILEPKILNPRKGQFYEDPVIALLIQQPLLSGP